MIRTHDIEPGSATVFFPRLYFYDIDDVSESTMIRIAVVLILAVDIDIVPVGGCDV